jgi:hypothetical protein
VRQRIKIRAVRQHIACFICRPLLAVGEYHITGKNQSRALLDATGIWTATDVREGGKWKIRLLSAIPKAAPASKVASAAVPGASPRPPDAAEPNWPKGRSLAVPGTLASGTLEIGEAE